MIPISLQAPIVAPREPKEMLSYRKLPDGRTEIRINYSSASLISLCKRKAQYALSRKLVSNLESEATLFGRAIHAGLEVWYAAPRESRRGGTSMCDDSVALMESGAEPLAHGQCVRCSAQAAFLRTSEALSVLDSGDKRSRRAGTAMLDAYFDHYVDDPFVVLRDALGPICERKVELVVYEDSQTRVVFFGTIDTVLLNERTNHIVVCDHKTTSSLGQEFIQRIDPNNQYRGYMAAFHAIWPTHGTRTFMSNGLQVAKTKTAFARQFVEIDDAAVAEWREWLLDIAYDWYHRTEHSHSFPMSAPDPCTQWGGCQYRAICTTPVSLRENVIRAQYEETLDESTEKVVV